ncbi:AbrB/MazE/SpoVT family DNA-binding domain-containing protein [Pseudomonas syringae group genomosp. 3]|uniref:AbrB/MazE/SpoVT family DNA-binding domain-containing protein n=1 Tax=Pseudomonas syringae group genomosp. 3 TaxID=251701 RepID=UPI0018C1F048|nr:AbrB/MazE/SpoVT family DNA-binding domain-containing protein [Pseudomonas syringae group genomosp. 3]
MSSHHLWTIQCQETNDCSGDLIINLPSELLNQMALAIGDDLAVDVVGRSIILRPISDLATRQARIGVAARQDFSRTYRHRLRYLLNISTSQHLNRCNRWAAPRAGGDGADREQPSGIAGYWNREY